jgi:hypothetical protein
MLQFCAQDFLHTSIPRRNPEVFAQSPHGGGENAANHELFKCATRGKLVLLGQPLATTLSYKDEAGESLDENHSQWT